ncbi:MAG: OadG family protein [Clostridia bacterium]|nr:OadG family protein [Clostridia bacterium]
MNYIILEGTGLYLFLVLVILMFLISLFSLICSAISEKCNSNLNELLSEEKEKVKSLVRENFRLKLKYGEFDNE